ncbi:hypothetical protein H4219_005297, partial [Mycoemilia scoparia]
MTEKRTFNSTGALNESMMLQFYKDHVNGILQKLFDIRDNDEISQHLSETTKMKFLDIKEAIQEYSHLESIRNAHESAIKAPSGSYKVFNDSGLCFKKKKSGINFGASFSRYLVSFIFSKNPTLIEEPTDPESHKRLCHTTVCMFILYQMVQKHSYLTDKDCKIIADSIGMKRKIESCLDNDETLKAIERGEDIRDSFKITLTWLYGIFNGICDKLEWK